MAMGNNVGCVDHVAMMVWPENLDASIERLSKMLEVEFQYFDAEPQGIRGAISPEAGLEFITPLRNGSPASDSLVRLLEEKGEGIHSIIFGVADAHGTKERLDAQGFKTRGVFDADHDQTPQFVRDLFSTQLELHMKERISGSLFVLSQIERREPEEQAAE